jgi:hypothetical protein
MGGAEGTGVLRFAQDDRKNNGKDKDRSRSPTGMTTKKHGAGRFGEDLRDDNQRDTANGGQERSATRFFMMRLAGVSRAVRPAMTPCFSLAVRFWLTFHLPSRR